MLAMGASVVLTSTRGERVVPIGAFLVDTFTTSAEPDELVTEIRVPIRSRRYGSAYLTLAQPASGFAVVGVAVWLRLASNGHCEDIGVGVTGLSEKPFRAKTVEECLRGNKLTPKLIEEGAAQVAQGREPLGDLHSSAKFRTHLAQVYTLRAIAQAGKRATARNR